MVLILSFIFAFPLSTELIFSDLSPAETSEPQMAQASFVSLTIPAVTAVERMLAKYNVSEEHRARIARAIISSSQKYSVDPRLVTSIVLVESGANPFAISDRDSVGIMQIHVRTWGVMADRERINLFRIEDNVDFGVRILKGYVQRHGLWEGVRRYRGWTHKPESQVEADDYLQKVQRVYGLTPSDQPEVLP